MSGYEIRLWETVAEGPDGHGRVGQDGGLSVLRQLEGFFWAFGHQPGEIKTQRGIGVLKDSLGRGLGSSQGHTHAHSLGTLSREQPCDFTHGYL
jgi:hypothetical protein